MIIGISGKSGSGKSSISRIIEKELGFKWLEIDNYAKEIRENHKDDILRLVDNHKIINSDKIDSKVLGNLLFDNEELMKEYNQFIYSKLKTVIDEDVKKYPFIIVDSLFLPIMEIFNKCDYKILVKSNDKLRIERLLNRENITLEYLKKRESYAPCYNESDFDLVLDNNGSLDIKDLIENIKKLKLK